MSQQQHRDIRLHYLDGARGVAAFAVFVYHVLDAAPWHGTTFSYALSCFFNGGDSVSFFFVLSGFVLSYKYIEHKPDKLDLSLKQYVNNRIWRLYPAFIVTLFIYYYLAQPPDAIWDGLITNGHMFLDEASLIKNTTIFNYADWTLPKELGISLILPFLMAAVLYNRKWLVAMLLIFLFCIRIHNDSMIHFVLGMIAAYYYRELRELRHTHPGLWRWRWPILIFSFFVFTFRLLRHLWPFLDFLLGKMFVYAMVTEFTLTAFAAFVFIVYLFNSYRAQAVMGSRPIHFLGKISYSVYLIQALWATTWFKHVYAFITANITTDSTLSFIVYVIIGGSLLIASASILYYGVELPFMRMGRRFSKKYLQPEKA